MSPRSKVPEYHFCDGLSRDVVQYPRTCRTFGSSVSGVPLLQVSGARGHRLSGAAKPGTAECHTDAKLLSCSAGFGLPRQL